MHDAPTNYVFMQNYPNPFPVRIGPAFGGNPSTAIKFVLPKNENVKIEVFNLLGKKISTLLDKPMPFGVHTIKFEAHDLSSGVYICKITAGNFQDTKKMMLFR